MGRLHGFGLKLLGSVSTMGLALTLTPSAALAQTAPESPTARAVADPVAPNTGDSTVAPKDQPSGDIVVTARLRSETLLDVPVAVSALSAEDIVRYNATDLTKIGELTPTVIISNYRTIGGGSLSIRGISSPPTQVGYEQPVSVALDGVQTSSGRVATLGFFDMQQVEILKGPQALFFGKNSPAGVISVTSAGPTRDLTVGARAAYEFVADEVTTEGFIAGPIAGGIGGRLALKYRDMKGWLHNNAQPAANPFFPAALPAATGRLPGPPDDRVGDYEIMGRGTLEFAPTDNLTITGKLFGLKGIDQGGGSYSQNIGPCSDGKPRSFGVVDPFGDCRPDNHTSFSNIVPAIASRVPALNGDNRSRGRQQAITTSLNMKLDLGALTLTSITGTLYNRYRSISGLTHTVDNALTTYEDTSYRAFSQEVRALTKLGGRVNFLFGAYYQNAEDKLYNHTNFRADISYNPATDQLVTYVKQAYLKGRAYSAFGQAVWDVTDRVELAAGARWTSERKRTRNQNLYGVNTALGRFATQTTVFAGSTDPTPGVLAATFKDKNISPEVTLTYRPVSNSAIYVAYKTGFKSGGFGITSPIQTTTLLSDIDFDSETVKGIEFGAKGQVAPGLRLQATAFGFNFKNLQVTTYDAAAIRFQINNAGAVRQRGVELEADYRAMQGLNLRGAIAYVRNRFRDYTGQCYGYTIPVAQALTAAAPPGCSFVLNPNGSRALTAAGGAILQQVFDGHAPARSPDWAGNAGFDYTRDLGASLEWTLNGDAFYSSSYYAGDTLAPATKQDAFWRFNAGIKIGARDDRWSIGLIGRNLTNKYYLLFAGDRTGGTSVPLTQGEQRGVVARGREIAIQGNVRF